MLLMLRDVDCFALLAKAERCFVNMGIEDGLGNDIWIGLLLKQRQLPEVELKYMYAAEHRCNHPGGDCPLCLLALDYL